MEIPMSTLGSNEQAVRGDDPKLNHVSTTTSRNYPITMFGVDLPYARKLGFQSRAGTRRSGCPAWEPLNKSGNAKVTSVSCTSASDCAAGRHYRDQHRHYQRFVAAERRGRWGRAAGIPAWGTETRAGTPRSVGVQCRA